MKESPGKFTGDVAAHQAQLRQRYDVLQAEKRKRHPPPTLGDLKAQKLLESWEGNEFIPSWALDRAREILHSAIDELIALGSTASRAEQKAVFCRCVEQLNTLNDRTASVSARKVPMIETAERDHLGRVFEDIAFAAGLNPTLDVVDELMDGRTW